MEQTKKVKLTKYEKWFRSMHRWERVLYRVLYPYKRIGHTQKYDDKAYIFVGNHLSLFDVIYSAMATTKPVHFLAKKDLFEKGRMKKFVTKCQCIPVSRDGNDVKAIMQAIKYLKNGESIAIYPEGTRNKTNEIFLPFKSGAAAISIKTKTPIVPIVHLNKIRLFKREYVLYGDPIEFSEFYDKKLTEEDIAACDEKLRNLMLDMYYKLAKKYKSTRLAKIDANFSSKA